MRAPQLLALAFLFAAIAACGCLGQQHYAASNLPPGGAAQNGSLKVIGMVGGVSWFSSEEYYRIMNQRVDARLGDPHSAKILMYSIDFNDVSEQVERGNPDDLAIVSQNMVSAAKRLEAGGADFIIVGSNTMNAFDGDIEADVKIPVLHIADATGKKVKESGIRKVALIGSNIVVQHDYYMDILANRYGLAVVLPNKAEQDYINSAIFKELVVGNFRNETRQEIVGIIERLAKENGAEGAILGCTELPLLINQNDTSVPVFDTTQIHAEAAADYAMGLYNLTG